MNVKTCEHLESVTSFKKADRLVCEDCIKEGTAWVHLRTCQSCGITLCCDSSERQHARKHFNQTGHPVVQSAEPGENWLWCYEDELFRKP